jgi:hypothetical protein
MKYKGSVKPRKSINRYYLRMCLGSLVLHLICTRTIRASGLFRVKVQGYPDISQAKALWLSSRTLLDAYDLLLATSHRGGKINEEKVVDRKTKTQTRPSSFCFAIRRARRLGILIGDRPFEELKISEWPAATNPAPPVAPFSQTLRRQSEQPSLQFIHFVRRPIARRVRERDSLMNHNVSDIPSPLTSAIIRNGLNIVVVTFFLPTDRPPARLCLLLPTP